MEVWLNQKTPEGLGMALRPGKSNILQKLYSEGQKI
jgi:hypothetical protein